MIECINSILNTKAKIDTEIIVVDNNSSDDTVSVISELFPEIRIIENTENKGYSGAVNQGAKLAKGEYLIISNADIVFQENTIYNLIDKLKKDDTIGIISPQQTFENGDYQRSYGYYPSIKRGIYDLFLISKITLLLRNRDFSNQNYKQIKVEYLDGALLCTTKHLFDELGGFDEDFFFYSEEVDFCYRVNKSGLKCILSTSETVIHHRGGSQENKGMNKKSIEMLINSEIRFIRKYQSEISVAIYLRLEYLFFLLILVYNKITEKKDKLENNKKYLKIIKKAWNEVKL